MGHFIEQVARRRGHEIVCIIDRDNTSDFRSPAFAQADVAIEFSTPATAEANIRAAWLAGIPVVCGTTGWNVQTLRDELCDEAECCQVSRRALLWSSNFSVGVNIFFALNKRLAGLLADYPDYLPSITETHHIHKLDAPSGTAKTLAEDIERFRLQVSGTKLQVPIESIREGEVPGIHTLTYDSEADMIQITHSAHNRKGFALGAVLAAEFTATHSGLLTTDDLFQF